MDSVFKKKSLEQQITKLSIQVTEALRSMGVNKQSTQVKVTLMDAVRKASDVALSKAWPAAVHLRGEDTHIRTPCGTLWPFVANESTPKKLHCVQA